MKIVSTFVFTYFQRCGGVELPEDVENYGHEIKIVIPSDDEDWNLKFLTKYMDTLRRNGGVRDFFDSNFIMDSVSRRTLLDLNIYR